MGTIVERKRSNGSIAYNAQVLKKQKGRIVYRKTQTFDRKAAAKAWIKAKEKELESDPTGSLLKARNITLSDAIDKYIQTSSQIGRSKKLALQKLKTYPIALLACGEVKSTDIVELAEQISRSKNKPLPQTVANYLSHLASIFDIASPAWGYPLEYDEISLARKALRRLGKTRKSKKRDRRPTWQEMRTLIYYFYQREKKLNGSMPMHKIIAFAIYSSRRQEEITSLRWDDVNPDHSTGPQVLVRDMKHPGEKVGNNVWCKLCPEAVEIIETMPQTAPEIFPYNHRTISANFTRACKVLGIKDLRFHDLRHEAASRLLEIGTTIDFAAKHTGHRSWTSLQRYSHVEKKGDKYEKAIWKPLVGIEREPNLAN